MLLPHLHTIYKWNYLGTNDNPNSQVFLLERESLLASLLLQTYLLVCGIEAEAEVNKKNTEETLIS